MIIPAFILFDLIAAFITPYPYSHFKLPAYRPSPQQGGTAALTTWRGRKFYPALQGTLQAVYVAGSACAPPW